MLQKERICFLQSSIPRCRSVICCSHCWACCFCPKRSPRIFLCRAWWTAWGRPPSIWRFLRLPLKTGRWLLAAALGGLFGLSALFLPLLPQMLQTPVPIFAAGNVVFLIYDYGFSKLIAFYTARLHSGTRHF